MLATKESLMGTDKDRYREQTRTAILRCAKWLYDNEDVLADEFVNDGLGCTSWSLTFSYDPQRYPGVMVDTDCRMMAAIDDAYSS